MCGISFSGQSCLQLGGCGCATNNYLAGGFGTALQSSVPTLQDALLHTVGLHSFTLWTKIEREGRALLCPRSQRATRESRHPQVSCVTWTPCTSCRCGSGWLWGATEHSVVRKQSWRQWGGKPRAAGSWQWGPAECSAPRNARLPEPGPWDCSTGPAPAGALLGKSRQG